MNRNVEGSGNNDPWSIESELPSPFSYELVRDPETNLVLIRLKYKNKQFPGKNLQAAIAPEFGSNLLEFKLGNHNFLYTDPKTVRDGGWTGCSVVWPLLNRYDKNGEEAYEFEGIRVSLADNTQQADNRNMVRGLVDDQEWDCQMPIVAPDGVLFKTSIEINDSNPHFEQFPFRSSLGLEYKLTENGLEIAYSANNMDSRNMPLNFALHPHWRLLSGREGTLVRIPAKTHLETDDELLPTGKLTDVWGTRYDLTEAKQVKNMYFNDVWTDLFPGQYPSIEYTTWGVRVVVKTTPDITHTALYTQKEGEMGFICLEPQAGATNAINLDAQAIRSQDEALARAAHLIVVPPGGSHEGKVTFLIERL